MYFNVGMNNVRQHQNNVVLFNVEFRNVGQRRNNVVVMTISKQSKKISFQIECSELKVLTAISLSPSLYSPFYEEYLEKYLQSRKKIKITKNTALQELDLNRLTLYSINWILTSQEAGSSKSFNEVFTSGSL